MRLPHTEHTSRAWRIDDIARDFRLEDVWALPTPGNRDDFPKLVEQFVSFSLVQRSPAVVRGLFAIRLAIGNLLGWDSPRGAAAVPTLRDKLPAELRERPAAAARPPFTTLYQTSDEWAAETVNRTVHGVLHLGWVEAPTGEYRGQMAVLVKRRGLLGAGYMAAIAPFRYLIVYPLMLRALGRGWQTCGGKRTGAAGLS
ncbi:MAG: hypothetical protein JWR32_178 [Mycobacterium sp.]|jgi:hypothetical protein|nr:hypothetical protein [Mycobacterium sp.]